MSKDQPDPARGRVALTREWLREGGIEDMVARTAPTLRLLSDAERAASLRAVLAARQNRDEAVWLFGYGSLIWNPTVRYAERRVACVPGWHRCFCLAALAGRGTPEKPGLLLGLDRGGRCVGVALRLPAEGLEEELSLLWRREMVAGSYVPRWVPLHALDGTRFGDAIAFTINPDAPSYAGDLEREEVVHRLATAYGELGSAAEYLQRTREGLRTLGIHDELVEMLAAQVDERLAARRAEPPATGEPG